MLVLGRKPGESIAIGNDIILTFVSVDIRGHMKIAIDAPKNVAIVRTELLDKARQQQDAK